MSELIKDFVAKKLQSMRLITCMLPDDGTDLKLIELLRKEKEIIMADSISCRGISVLNDADRFIKLVEIIVPELEADMLFSYIYIKAQINRPNGGWIAIGEPIYSTAFSLPNDTPKEAD